MMVSLKYVKTWSILYLLNDVFTFFVIKYNKICRVKAYSVNGEIGGFIISVSCIPSLKINLKTLLVRTSQDK